MIRASRPPVAEFGGVRRRCLLALLPASLALPAPGAAQEPDRRLTPGDHELAIVHDGRTRTYLVHAPPVIDESAPVVLAFHGGGGFAGSMKRKTGFDTLADEQGFVAVYPNGSGLFCRRLLTWNAEDCCGYAMDHGVDDVGFVRALLDHLASRLPIDESRIYATGHSNGGMFCYRLAAEAADRVAAIAPVAGAAFIDSIRASRPVPLMHIHSVDDPRALYAGGLGPPFPFTRRRVLHVPVDSVLAQWIAHNRCPGEPEIDARVEAPELGHSATRYVFGPCADRAELVLWKMRGPGHGWPGGEPMVSERIMGAYTDVIDATREV